MAMLSGARLALVGTILLVTMGGGHGQSDPPGSNLRLPPATPGTTAPAPAVQQMRPVPPMPAASAPTAPSPTVSSPATSSSAAPAREPPRDLGNFVDINRRANSSFPTGGYNYPALMSAIYESRFDDVPDDRETRSLAFSVLKAFSESCGPPSPRVTIASTVYVSDEAREANRNPGKAAGQLLMDFAKMIQKPPAEGITEFIEKRGVVSPDAEVDGRLLASRAGCSSDVYRKFADNLGDLIINRSSRDPAASDDVLVAALMSSEYRARKNIPDPAIELARRKTAALKKNAQTSCDKGFDRQGFCACAMKGLDQAGIDDPEWEALGSSFHFAGTLGAKRAEVMKAVRSCYKPPA